jgi:hypothetical protein
VGLEGSDELEIVEVRSLMYMLVGVAGCLSEHFLCQGIIYFRLYLLIVFLFKVIEIWCHGTITHSIMIMN